MEKIEYTVDLPSHDKNGKPRQMYNAYVYNVTYVDVDEPITLSQWRLLSNADRANISLAYYAMAEFKRANN